MIAIVNKGKLKGDQTDNPLGWRKYEVRVNNKIICTFTHKRINGLSQCLLEASRAVKEKSLDDTTELLLEMTKSIKKDGEKGIVLPLD